MLVSVGVSHKRASLATLDALTLRDLGDFYTDLRAIREIGESVVLQTCNRVEVFLEAKSDLQAESVLRTWALATPSYLSRRQDSSGDRRWKRRDDHRFSSPQIGRTNPGRIEGPSGSPSGNRTSRSLSDEGTEGKRSPQCPCGWEKP